MVMIIVNASPVNANAQAWQARGWKKALEIDLRCDSKSSASSLALCILTGTRMFMIIRQTKLLCSSLNLLSG